ncbi:GNAT family N-acetyltransferase [Photobacterium sp. 1_MG-2023]|uniref:GNAT family N-acetyltransferase n=1 Tax=Photobacterium sp. 1_MG-2023 TaxID=3062646 RepID=UPI0026E4075C|nr:GNAT family N-acetyltransferase [Photobacterium sp. 1_MG-2023]MDO6706867.1 GNAT family N-acetyltransferase [Photobacterium sp. 1_MG-2023]
MQFVHCTYESHGEAIQAIFNDAILNTTALYEYQPRTMAVMQTWFETKKAHDFPVIGLENEAGELMGFASYGTFRAWAAFKYSVEHSVYIHPDHQGKGLGKVLMAALIQAARSQNYHVLVGGIDSSNAGSIALHKKLGFQYSGTIQQAAYKFDRWLDLDFYQLTLETPLQPVAG